MAYLPGNHHPHKVRVPPDSPFHACQYVRIATSSSTCIPVQVHPDPTLLNGTTLLPRWTKRHLRQEQESVHLVAINEAAAAAAAMSVELTLHKASSLLDGSSAKVQVHCQSVVAKLHGLPVFVGCLVSARHLGRLETFRVTKVDREGSHILPPRTTVHFVQRPVTKVVTPPMDTFVDEEKRRTTTTTTTATTATTTRVPAFQQLREELELLVSNGTAPLPRGDSLMPVVPQCVLLCGVTGSGKTTLLHDICRKTSDQVVIHRVDASSILDEIQSSRERNGGRSSGVPQLDTIFQAERGRTTVVGVASRDGGVDDGVHGGVDCEADAEPGEEETVRMGRHVVVLDDIELVAQTTEEDEEGNGMLDPASTRGARGDALRYLLRFIARLIRETSSLVVGVANVDASQLSSSLRSVLAHHLTMPSLDHDSREEVLESMFRSGSASESESESGGSITKDTGWERLADQTGGYTMSDFVRLRRHVDLQLRAAATPPATSTAATQTIPRPRPLAILSSHVERSLPFVRPSTLSSLNVRVPTVTFDDIGGYDDVKFRLTKTIEWQWTQRTTMIRLGISSTSGVLLHGPTGCGKTMFAEALASECRCNFISVRLHDVFSAYLGESERYLRELFRVARTAIPCMLFLDDLDVIASKRDLTGGTGGGGGGGGSGTVAGRVLATLLNEMDGVESNEGVVVVGATSSKEDVDPALLRPGRLDVDVSIRAPTTSDRIGMLRVLTKTTPLDDDVDLERVAAMAEGWDGATMTLVCRCAALHAMRELESPSCVSMRHYVAAVKEERATKRNPTL